MQVSILEQSVSVEGKPQTHTIQDSINLAVKAEKLGYKRFWVSEHHNHPTIIGSAPEVLMAAIATKTKTIRIGSAGIMLPHYAPFKVAEQFRVLEAIAPDASINITIEKTDGETKDIKANHSLSDEQIEWFKAGSALNSI